MKSFAEVVREKRRAAGLSQQELAERSGLSAGTIHSYERGGACPPIPCLKLLARALDIPLVEMLDLEFPSDHRQKTVTVND